jgi:hypothetical protein
MQPEPSPQPKPATATRSTAAYASSGYGISEVIKLMRSVPVEQNPELVVRVIKAALESMNVKVNEIIEDAGKKQQKIQDRINAVDAEIADYSKQIESRRQEIGKLKTDLNETVTARQRLELAEKGAAAASAPAPAPAAASSPVKIPSVKPPVIG